MAFALSLRAHAVDPSTACSNLPAPNTYVSWSSSTTGVNTPATAPALDTSFPNVTCTATTPCSKAYFAQGKKLLAFRNVADMLGGGHAAGTLAWTWCPNETTLSDCVAGTATINNFPSPVPMSNTSFAGPEFVFFGASDGFLYKIDTTTGTSGLTVDTRRKLSGNAECTTAPGDVINATPAVVLYAFASTTPGSPGLAFRQDIDSNAGHGADDVVIVATADGCGDTTRNRVIAYFAKDLSQKWVFNVDGAVKVDRFSEGCEIDYDNMRLYCATDLADGAAGQSSLFALNAINGQLLWSGNAGAVITRPQLNFTNGRLYVVDKTGAMMAYDAAGNGLGGVAPLWSAPLMVAGAGTVISRSPAVESRSGSWQNKILVLDSAGSLHAVKDNGTTGSILWDLSADPGVSYRSLPVVIPDPNQSRALIGRSDGYIQMVGLNSSVTDPTPIPQGIVQVNAGAVNVFDPSLDAPGGVLNKAVVVAGTTVNQLNVPFCANTPQGLGANCNFGFNPDECKRANFFADYNPCFSTKCDFSLLVCIIDAGNLPDGTPCDDGWLGSPPGTKGACTSSTLASLAGFNTSDCTKLFPTPGGCPPGWDCMVDPVTYVRSTSGPCFCNNGTGRNCNDACIQGVCTKNTYTACPCTNPGDDACAAGVACCGQLTGGCVNLANDVQHCGDCFTDCNTYYTPVPAVACAADSTCTAQANGTCKMSPGKACAADSDCTGIAGSCVCSGTCSASNLGVCAATTACTADSNCGPGGKCNCSGTCSSSNLGTCYHGSCHYLLTPGTCTNGVCGSEAACTAPSVGDFQTASPAGVVSITFDRASTTCDAFVSDFRDNLPADAACALCDSTCTPANNKRCCSSSGCLAVPNANTFCCPDGKSCVSGTCREASVQKISSGGSMTPFASTDGALATPHPLNGIGVLRSGIDAFVSYVNDSAATAGMGSANGTSYQRRSAAASTMGAANTPFAQAQFNNGPVGPAVDTSISSDAAWTAYFANFSASPCADLKICKFTGSATTVGTTTAVPWTNQSPCSPSTLGICTPNPAAADVNAQRITAMAFAELKYAPPNVFHRYLVIGHGANLSLLDLDGGTPVQKDIDLTNLAVYNPTTTDAQARGESTPEAILSIAVAPDGDLLVEVRGAGNGAIPKNRFLLNIDAHDQSVRNQRMVQRDLLSFHPCVNGTCPTSMSCIDGVCLPNCGGCPTHATCTNVGLSGNCETPAGGGTRNVCCPDFAVPNNFGLTDGRLTVTPDGQLLRFVPVLNAAAASWNRFQLTR